MQDPFYSVKDDVQQALQGTNQLYQRWKDLLSTTNIASNDEYKWVTNELRSAIQSIEKDLSVLEQTVNAVEANKVKFRVDDAEIMSRRNFISTTKQKITGVKEDMLSSKTKAKMEKDQRETLIVKKKDGTRKHYNSKCYC